MKSGKILILLLLFTLIAACGGGDGGGGGGGGSTTPTLASISVSPANPSIATGTTQQFKATGTYSDNTTQDLTTSVTWSSSVESVAVISDAAGSNGKAISIAAGTTTIAATSGNISGSTTLTVISGAGTNNVMLVTVNGSLCSTTNAYLNKICVSVTVCTPGTSTCQTINDILLDTGSYGLRIFKQALTVSLSQVMDGSRSLAECVQFGDGTSEWGPIQTAGVILGNEPVVQVPIQVIDATFGSPPHVCRNADLSPADAGFNGTLGVGLLVHDCGSTCVTSSGNGLYYACSGTSCTGTVAALTAQVQNPVALLPQDNNGVILQLPGVDPGGALSVTGNLILGIGTQSNNAPTGVTAYSANQSGEFTTNLNGSSYSNSIIDSGSNGLFFPSPSSSVLPNCPSPNSGWFCPSTTTSFSATNTASSGSPSGTVTFQIGNFNSLTASSNNVFSEIGGSFAGQFDWGLPFHFGRSVYIGIEGKSSSLGSGPYWAY